MTSPGDPGFCTDYVATTAAVTTAAATTTSSPDYDYGYDNNYNNVVCYLSWPIKNKTRVVRSFCVGRVYTPIESSGDDDGPQKYNSSLCGFPIICSENASTYCPDTILLQSNQCEMWKAIILAIFFIGLGLLIILANALVVWQFIKLKRKSNSDTVKISLAIADFCSGVLIAVVAPFNLYWTVFSTPKEINTIQLNYQGSPEAIIGGILNLFTFTCSIYHLIYLGLLRLYSIKFPMKYRHVTKKRVACGSLLVWILALLCAASLAWFPKEIVFSYYVTTFMFFPSMKHYVVGESSGRPALAMMTSFILVPYIILTIISITSSVSIWNFYKSAKNLTTSNIDKKKIKSLKTVAVMQIGFTIVIMPQVITTVLFYAGVLTCDKQLSLIIATFISMTNGFINFLIYSFMDRKFRRSLVASFCPSRYTQTITTSSAATTATRV